MLDFLIFSKSKINHVTKRLIAKTQNSKIHYIYVPCDKNKSSLIVITYYKHITAEKNVTIQLFCTGHASVFIYKNMRYFIYLLFIAFLCETSNAAVETVCRGWRRSHARKAHNARNEHVNTRTKHLMHLKIKIK